MTRICVIPLALLSLSALADSTISPTEKFAYSGNAGWINFRPGQPTSPDGIVFGDYFVSGKAYGANIGWVDFGNGAPANGIRYQNNGSDFGVNHDGSGNLSGFAYSANTGWINFGWTDSTDANRPRVNLGTGAFEGFAYSANLGWINLAGNLVTVSMKTVDEDADGIADAWERIHFGDLTSATGSSDFDMDGATDINEYLAATLPKDSESFLRITSTRYSDGFTQAMVTFTTDASRMYRIETADSLDRGSLAWEDSGLGTFGADSGGVTARVISWAGASKKFIRVVAVKPLQP